MKAALSTALSMTAILGTGGAALAVNATVLQPQTVSDPATSQTSAPEVTSTPTTDQFGGVEEFQIPGVGLVAMVKANGRLMLQSVTANTGYTYAVTGSTSNRFEITFESQTSVVKFSIQLVNDQIVASATAMDGSTIPPAPNALPTSDPGAGPPNSAAAPGGNNGSGGSNVDDRDHDRSEFGDDGFEFEGGGRDDD